MKPFLIAVLLGGCGLYFGEPGSKDPVPDPGPDPAIDGGSAPDPGGCSLNIYLNSTHLPLIGISTGVLTLDSTGTTVCLELDASDSPIVAHFKAASEREEKATSTFQLTLLDANDNLLRDGWDAAYPPFVFANLEHDVTKGTILHAKLHARTVAGIASTDISLSLFEGLE